MRTMGRRSATALLALVMSAALSGTARAAADPWSVESNWLSVRGGYAKNSAQGAGNGGAGFGLGFSHMLRPSRVSDWRVLGRKPLGFLHWTLFKQFSIGANVNYDVISRFGSASEIEVPATVELVRHIRLKAAPWPYVGVGLGAHFLKTYHTGADNSQVSLGKYVTTGANMSVGPNQLLGLDVRLASVNNYYSPENPVFGSGQHRRRKTELLNGVPVITYDDTALHWSVKLSYSIAY